MNFDGCSLKNGILKQKKRKFVKKMQDLPTISFVLCLTKFFFRDKLLECIIVWHKYNDQIFSHQFLEENPWQACPVPK